METELQDPQATYKYQNKTKQEILVTPVRYCLYARKSSESDEKQALSIDSQIKEMLALAESEGLNVTEIRQESKSAKDSGNRPVFQSILKDMEQDVFNGIITWAPDRLSRNAGDLGKLVDLMDQGILENIRTYGQYFTNSPNDKFLLMILCSQAKLENDNRGINVKRGLRTRCEMGTRPGCVPLGYKLIRNPEKLNEPSKITVDEERAPFIKKMFEYVAEKQYSGRQIHEYLTDEGFRTKNNKKLTLGTIFRIFKETFYYGEFEFPRKSGNWYKGSHEPLITKEIFDKAKSNLKVCEKSKWGAKSFYFSKLFKCGHCGSGITGEDHINRYGKLYIYYKCNKHGGSKTCRSKYIREEKLIESISKIIDQLKGKYMDIEKKIEKEVEKFNDMQSLTGNSTKISSEEYVQYLLKNGSAFEKQKILRCIEDDMFLEDGEIVFKN